MSVATLRELLMASSAGGYAVGAFNVTSIVQLAAAVEAAAARRSPLIVQTSAAPVKFLGPAVWAAAFRAAADPAGVPVALHLDHCTDPGLCRQCVDAGYTSVMIDASKQAFEENLRQTREVCAYAHARGVSVEGELGTITGVEDQVKVAEDESALCDPERAVTFVDATGVDALAPAIGTAHGIYATRDPKLRFDLLGEINRRINGAGTRVPLVIHGGTGLPPESVRRLISLGGAKLNVSTELKHVLLDVTSGYISAHPREYDPGKVDSAVRKETAAVIGGWMDLLGCSGKAAPC
jgi:ketose-bisphosphate aldolase